MPRTATNPPCPIGRAVDVLGDRWTLLIMRNATHGTTRFDEFREELGIADNILSARLSSLVAAGLLTRVPYRDGGRTRQEYRLTEAGTELAPVLRALADWGTRHTTPAEPAAPMQFLHRECGHHLSRPEVHCDHCRRPVSREDQLWLRPWRDSAPYPLAAAVTAEQG
ncbi:MAG: HxlR family transcriptional regulator [Streptosporangiaceae bacterium]|jgi:DNA-binding HxlR family transcriptional regulator|nr:HxlR family transcriptional regulator [Streptosporangiaceae bacterium]